MKHTLKTLAALLALLMVLSVVLLATSCGGGETEGSTEGTESGDVAPESSTSDTKKPEIPTLEVKNLNGREFVILWPEVHGDGHYLHNEIAVTETSGDVIDMAVATRNAIVERTYNVKITTELKFISRIPVDNKTEATSGISSHDAMVSTIKFMTTNAMEGLLTDYNELKYYNEEQTWWNHRLMEDFAIAGARYFGSGDIIYSDDFYPYCVYLNTAVADSAQINEDFYSLVKDKEWTLDKFHMLAKQAQSVTDHTANPDNWVVGETAGAVVNENFARASYYAAGQGMLTFDESGKPSWAMEVSRTQEILEKIIDVIHGGKALFNAGQFDKHADVEKKAFNENKTLFLVEELIISERLTKSDSVADFQILPFPLYDEDSEYISVLNDAAIISIPLMAKKTDEIGLILSAMSRESVNTLTPAFFETVLKARYMQDGQSVEMLQIILNSTVAPDVATVQDWGGFMAEFKRLAFEGTTDFSSYYAEHISEARGLITEYIQLLNQYHGIQ